MGLWLVRGGRNGEYEEAILERGITALAYRLVTNLSTIVSRDKLRQLLAAVYPNDSVSAQRVHERQLWQFYEQIQDGDFVVMPSRDREAIHIGVVDGPYEYRDGDVGFEHARTVSWKRRIMRGDFDNDILSAISHYPGTLKEIKLAGAENLIAQLIDPDAPRIITKPRLWVDDLVTYFEEPSVSVSRETSLTDIISEGVKGFTHAIDLLES